jgi:hypothetical protein
MYNKMKNCSTCKVDQPLENFNKDKRRSDGVDYVCKMCKKLYYKQNKEKILLKHKEYYLNHVDERKEYLEKYYSKEENKIKRRKRERDRWKNDEQYRIRMVLGWKINQSIQKKYKTLSSIELLGCNLEQVRNHLQTQFKPEMNWENHGDIWEIDHIKPCSSFNLMDVEEQKECFNYKNLQPLFKTTQIAEDLGYKNEIGNRNKSKSYV